MVWGDDVHQGECFGIQWTVGFFSNSSGYPKLQTPSCSLAKHELSGFTKFQKKNSKNDPFAWENKKVVSPIFLQNIQKLWGQGIILNDYELYWYRNVGSWCRSNNFVSSSVYTDFKTDDTTNWSQKLIFVISRNHVFFVFKGRFCRKIGGPGYSSCFLYLLLSWNFDRWILILLIKSQLGEMQQKTSFFLKNGLKQGQCRWRLRFPKLLKWWRLKNLRGFQPPKSLELWSCEAV